ncbi:DUF4444 domain-containing protein [Maribius pontilimi]|uniref:DUF4444 domain-containing protein n=1 Tax=Palleronia pontilimi TaxID=1964209 RepID=A0A934MIF5_9RHOB|nr:biotin/lipoate--protein ligase family protein [Palleronia pontilimi]MBJ3764209.1 DUF4444 domain-containing protein [Palleronia pontilimi]
MSLSLPPLFTSVAADGPPREHAVALARAGCDGGTVVHGSAAGTLEAAIVFAPETPLAHAAQILPVCAVGFQNALGALAPPEVAVHLGWDGAIRVNGGLCGALGLVAPAADPAAIPDWLIVTLSLDMLPASDDPGSDPDRTALYAEGCGDMDPDALVEAWVRHTLVWLNRWSDGDLRALHAEWRGLAHGLNTEITQGHEAGTFLGVDEDFAMLLKTGAATRAIPLATLVDVAD